MAVINNVDQSDKQSEIESVIRKNLEVSEEILKITKKVKSYLLWHKIFNIIKILLIITPFVLAYIYVPRLIDEFKKNPQLLLGHPVLNSYIEGVANTAAKSISPENIDLNNIDLSNIDLNSLPPEVKKMLK